jgi:hypothetical protein
MLAGLFRVLAWIALFGGAGFAGACFFMLMELEADTWSFAIGGLLAVVIAFWTFILWGVLLLFAGIADYLGIRRQFRMEGEDDE